MKRFNCTVERTDEYIIEFDENVINEDFLKGFSGYITPVSDHEELAEYIAEFRARHGERFIEGIGRPLQNGGRPSFANQEELNNSINIKIVSEDDDCDVNVEEI